MDKIGISNSLNSNCFYYSRNSFEITIENKFKIEKISSFTCNVENILVDFSEKGIFLTIIFDIKVNLFFLENKALNSLKEKNVFMHEIESNNLTKSISEDVSIYDMQLKILDNNSILIKIYFFITLNAKNDNYAAYVYKNKNKFTLKTTDNFFQNSKRLVLPECKSYSNVRFYKDIYNLLYTKISFNNTNLLCFYDIFKRKEIIISKSFSSINSFKILNNNILVRGIRKGKSGLYLIDKINRNISNLYINNYIEDFVFFNKNNILIALRKNNFFEFKVLNLISKEIKTYFKIKTNSLALVENESIFFFLENKNIKFSTLELNRIYNLDSSEKINSIEKVLKINVELFLILSKTTSNQSYLFVYSIKSREKYVLFKNNLYINDISLDYKKEFIYLVIKKDNKNFVFTINLNNYKTNKILDLESEEFKFIAY